jgi:hypothetical protein
MAKYDHTFEVVQTGEELPNLLVERATFKSGSVAYFKASVLDYDRNYDLIYAHSREEALAQLDTMIGVLQAVRQDLDLTTKE